MLSCNCIQELHRNSLLCKKQSAQIVPHPTADKAVGEVNKSLSVSRRYLSNEKNPVSFSCFRVGAVRICSCLMKANRQRRTEHRPAAFGCFRNRRADGYPRRRTGNRSPDGRPKSETRSRNRRMACRGNAAPLLRRLYEP